MKTLVVFYSLEGNTKAVAQLIARKLDADLNAYDTVYIGTPVWWFTFTPPIRAFLNKVSLEGKQVNIFCTHGGDRGKTIPDIANLLKGAKVVGSRDFYTTRKIWTKEEKWIRTKREVVEWIGSS